MQVCCTRHMGDDVSQCVVLGLSMPVVKHVTVVPKINQLLHRHTGNSTFAYSPNVNTAG